MNEPPRSGRGRSDAAFTLPLGTRSREAGSIALLVVVGVAVPLMLAVLSGSADIAHNDDFSYRVAAMTVHQEARFEFTGWGVMTLVGQLLFVQPFLFVFGDQHRAFALAGATAGAAAVGGAYLLARAALPGRRAVCVVLLLLAAPGFLAHTTTFMTDVPTLALVQLSLLAGVHAMRRAPHERRRWLVLSVALGIWAFSVREFAIAAPVAVLAVAAVSERSARRDVIVLASGLLLACAAIWLWTAGIPGQGEQRLQLLAPFNVRRTLAFVATLALVMSPAIIIRARAAGHGLLPGFWIGVLITTLLYGEAIARLASGDAWGVIVGNALDPAGSLGQAVLPGRRPDLFAGPIWLGLGVAASVSVIVAGGLVGDALHRVRRWPRRTLVGAARARLVTPLGVMTLFGMGYGAGLLLYGSLAPLWDRYLFPLVVPVGALLLRDRPRGLPPPRATAALAAFVGVGLAIVAIVLLLNQTAFDVARWRAGEAATRAGLRASAIDAGLEWVGSHVPPPFFLYPPAIRGAAWYVGSFPRFRPCAFVSSSPLDVPGFVLASADPDAYRLLLFTGPSAPLYLYRSIQPDCN